MIIEVNYRLTEKEADTLDGIIKYGSLSAYCEKTGTTKSAASGHLAALRRRAFEAKEFLQEYEEYRKRLPTKYL